MKKLLALVALISTISLHTHAQNALRMKGAYLLIKQTGNSGSGDSLLKKEQLKIYTDKYMIYASPQPIDSQAIYGIGTYKIQNGKVIENVIYSTTAGSRKDVISLTVKKTPEGYTQVIAFPYQKNKKYILTEEYKKVGKPTVTPLDGAWKQTANYYITKEGDTTTNKLTQYKVYQDGYFIWANTYAQALKNKPISSFGYGVFEMNGRDKSTEINHNSTFITDLINIPVHIQLKFMGRDMYKQTINYENGNRSVEIYKRLK
jgi:hypothetical protein